MASGFVAVVSLRKNSQFKKFDPSDYCLSDYDQQAAIWMDNEVISSNDLIDEFLEQTFESGNIGALREQLTRSLSVGDLVILEHVRTGKQLVCAIEPEGWARFTN